MKISRDSPLLYLTSVANNRLPVFKTDSIKEIVARALDEARRSAGILIFAYVIMPDHMHLITDGSRKSSEALKYFNGITAKRVIDHLKTNDFAASLEKLRTETKKRNYRHSLWEHHPNAFSINNEETLIQKVNYVHQNPVRAGLVERATDYLFSSARIWDRCPRNDEPLRVDLDQIEWRRSRGIT